jgi:hypothetical protein
MQIEVVSLHFIRANGGFEYVQLYTTFKSDQTEVSVQFHMLLALHPGKQLPLNRRL